MKSTAKIFLIAWFVLAAVAPAFAASPYSNNASLAVQWLASAQKTDGSWGDGDAKYPCTTEAVLALQALNQRSSAYYWGISWLENNSPANIDFMARRILALAPHGDNMSAETTALHDAQALTQPDKGGWGLTAAYQGSPLDSALALLAYAQQGITTNVPAAIAYLQAAQLTTANDMGWTIGQETTSDPATTALVVMALVANNGDGTLTTNIANGMAALWNKLGTGTHPVQVQALAALAYLKAGDTSKGTATLNVLAAAQATDGSWGQDAYATALTVRAMAAAMGTGVSSLAESVVIPDPNLRAAINRQLGKNAMDSLNKGELASLTTLNAQSRGIASLTGLEWAVNMTSIDLRGNSIGSLAPLSGLTNLAQIQFESPQTITFEPPASTPYSTTPLTLSATGGASGNPVTFTVTGGPGVINGNSLTITGVGSIAVSAKQAGNIDYFAAPDVPRTITVTKADQVIAFNPPTSRTYGDAPIVLTATGGASGNPVTFAVTSGPGTLSGNTLTITGAGNIAVTASQAGNANYNAAVSVPATISVAKAGQAITFSPPTPIAYSDVPFTLTASGGGSGNTVTFAVTGGPGVLTGNTLTITGIGDITVTASQAGSADYDAAANVLRTISVIKVTQVITFNAPTAKAFGDPPFAISVAGGLSGNPVTFAVTGPATLSGTTVTITGIGDIVIIASQAGNAFYDAALDVTRTITVARSISAAIAPTAIAADQKTSVTLTIANLAAAGDEVLLEQFVDANRNGIVDSGDYVIRSFKVTDGVATTNPNVQGDSDGAANSAIATALGYNLLNDLYHAPGTYLFRASKGAESSIVAFEVAPVSQLQTIAGLVTDGTNPVPGAMVQLTDKWQRPVAYTIADASGQYLLNVPKAGDYLLTPMAYGYTASATPITLAASQIMENRTLILAAGTYHVTGMVKDAASGAGIAGVWVQANGSSSGVAVTTAGGAYDLLLPAGQYSLNVLAGSSGPGLSAKGYVGFDKQSVAITVSGTTVVPDIGMTIGDIPASGQVLDSIGNPVAGVPLEGKIRGAMDSREPVSFGVSNASGAYSLALFGAAGWDISLDNAAAQSLGYLGTSRSNLTTLSGPVSGADLIVYPITAWVQGVVKDSANQLLSGVEVRLRNNASQSAAMFSASDGTYRLGAYPGDWLIDALTENRGTHPVADQSVTLTEGQTANLDFVVDVTPPVLTVDPVVSPTNIISQTITGTMETGAVVSVSIAPSATAGEVTYPTATTWSCVVGSLQEGANTITVSAVDAAGNPAAVTPSPVITLDTIPPVIAITSPLSTGTVNQTPLLVYSITDASTVNNVQVKIDNVPVSKVSGDYLDALAAGPHTVWVGAADAVGNPGEGTVTFTVVQPVQILTATLPSGDTGTVYSQTLTATGGQAPYAWSILTGSLPTGLILNAATGVISGTPASAGSSSFTVQVQDVNGMTATATLSISIASLSLEITTPATLPDVYVDSFYTLNLTASGGTAPYTWSSVLLGVTVAGVLSGTPRNPGSYTFTVTVLDSTGATATKVLTINVLDILRVRTVSLPPIISNAAYSKTLLADGGKPPFDWSITVGTLPAELSLNSTTGVISGTPIAEGEISVTVRVTDNNGVTASRNLATIPNQLVITTISLPDAYVGSAYTCNLTARGGTAPYTWSVANHRHNDLPMGMSLSTAGVLSGSPVYSVSDSFIVKVQDNTGATATKTLTINRLGALAISTASLPSGTVNTAYSKTLTVTGGKAPYTWAVSSGTLPPGLALSATGVISGTPTTTGTSSFTLKVTDGNGVMATKSHSLSIM